MAIEIRESLDGWLEHGRFAVQSSRTPGATCWSASAFGATPVVLWDAREFAGALDALLGDPTLGTTLGRHGRTYYQRHYNWPVIERHYLDMFERLGSEPFRASMEPLPGWWERRRRVLPPAAEVVDALPSGPVLVGAHA